MAQEQCMAATEKYIGCGLSNHHSRNPIDSAEDTADVGET
jgi:hypothetical protein